MNLKYPSVKQKRLKTDLKEKLEDYNRKDKEITEREMALDNGEYTGLSEDYWIQLKDTEKVLQIPKTY